MGAKVSFIEAGQPIQTVLEPAPLSVAASAILGEHDAHWVFVAQDGKAWRRDVVTGERDGPRVAIFSGLEQGERVILDPPAGLSNGAEIQYP